MKEKEYTFEDIIDEEKQLVIDAPIKYGEFWGNSYGFVIFMNRFIKSIDDIDKFLFLTFLSQVKKHLTLALFSTVRRHHVQANMDMRQVLEASSWAAYVMAFREENKFYENDTSGNLCVPKVLKEKRNKWLNENYQIKSDEIKRNITLINESTAHSNIAYAFNNFKMRPTDNPGFELQFFDHEDEYVIKTNLWSIANITMGLIDLFIGVNQTHKVFKLADDFKDSYRQLIELNNKLKSEMMAHKRYAESLKINSVITKD